MRDDDALPVVYGPPPPEQVTIADGEEEAGSLADCIREEECMPPAQSGRQGKTHKCT